MASTKLTRTNSTSGNRQIFTVSAWVKLSVTTSGGCIFSTGTAASDTGAFRILHVGASNFQIRSGATVFRTTSAVYRDTSAWYHIVVAQDSTQTTADDRLKLYVNGSQVTDFSANNAVPLNLNGPVNESGKIHTIGVRSDNGTDYWNGYMADFYLIDGQQLQASDFGQTDSTGIWKPKGYSGTYGTNGFYLKFSNSGDLGADSSGNGNNFTKSGNGRQRTDTPSNVFPTINALCRTNTNHVLSNGNLTHQVTSAWMYLPANMGASSGKWYAEMKIDAVTNNFNCGVMELSGIASDWMNNMNTNNTILGANTQGDAWALYGNGSDTGTYKNNNTPNSGNISTSFGSNIVVGDIISIALDCDNQKIWFGVNGSWDNSGDPAAGTNPMPYNTAMIAGRTYAFASGPEYATQSWNFGNPPYTVSSGNADGNGYGNFEYTPPTGFLAMCTKNLTTEAAPTIDDGSAYFQTALWTGTGASNSIVNDGNSDLQPDMIWFKSRTVNYDHRFYDSTRGTSVSVRSNTGDAENSLTNGTISYDTDGFTLGTAVQLNESSQNHVGWQWKANGGTTSSNTDGDITSTVQANTTAGFSIVLYTGNANASDQTVGHGLGAECKVVLLKNRTDTGQSWRVFHESVSQSAGGNLFLNGNSALDTGDPARIISTNTSTFTLLAYTSPYNAVNGSGKDYLAYCFAEVEGYSKFGKYVGTGNANGQFVHTGFRPAWVMVKRTDSGQGWCILDSSRNTYNVVDDSLFADLNNVEDVTTNDETDFLSNGFKQRNTGGSNNVSGATYIYMAFAEHPFVTSGGLPVTAR